MERLFQENVGMGCQTIKKYEGPFILQWNHKKLREQLYVEGAED